MHKRTKIYNKVLAVGFLSFLFLPLIVQLWPNSSNDNNGITENRILNKAPSIPSSIEEWQKFPKKFESYYKDQFGLRAHLLSISNNLKFELAISPNPLVLVNKDGWSFLALKSVTEPSRGALPLKDVQLQRLSHGFNRISRLFEEKGIHFLHFVVPEKQSIYPEHLPGRIKRVGASRLDQLNLMLVDDPHYVDVKKGLLKAKELYLSTALYYKIDSHWNCWGAYLAYKDVINKLNKDQILIVPLVKEDEFFLHDLSSENQHSYLSSEFWLTSFNSKDTLYECLLKKDQNIKMYLRKSKELILNINGERKTPEAGFGDDRILYQDWHAINEKPGVELKAIIIRDSFNSYLVQYFNRSFSEVLYVHYVGLKKLNLSEIIRTFKPDVVIYEYAERGLAKPGFLIRRVEQALLN